MITELLDLSELLKSELLTGNSEELWGSCEEVKVPLVLVTKLEEPISSPETSLELADVDSKSSLELLEISSLDLGP